MAHPYLLPARQRLRILLPWTYPSLAVLVLAILLDKVRLFGTLPDWVGGVLGLLVLPSILLLFVGLNFVSIAEQRCRERRDREARGQCPSCGYDLTGNVSGVCPECGDVVPAAGRGAAA